MTRLLSPLLTLILLPLIGHAETLPGPIPAEIMRVVDGDTIRLRAHIWLDQTLEIMVRIEGIDAPEIHRPNCSAERVLAQQAKAEVEALVTETVFLHGVHLGKYAGRVIAEARLPDGRVLADHLLDNRLAVPEDVMDPWCNEVSEARPISASEPSPP